MQKIKQHIDKLTYDSNIYYDFKNSIKYDTCTLHRREGNCPGVGKRREGNCLGETDRRRTDRRTNGRINKQTNGKALLKQNRASQVYVPDSISKICQKRDIFVRITRVVIFFETSQYICKPNKRKEVLPYYFLIRIISIHFENTL